MELVNVMTPTGEVYQLAKDEMVERLWPSGLPRFSTFFSDWMTTSYSMARQGNSDIAIWAVPNGWCFHALRPQAVGA